MGAGGCMPQPGLGSVPASATAASGGAAPPAPAALGCEPEPLTAAAPAPMLPPWPTPAAPTPDAPPLPLLARLPAPALDASTPPPRAPKSTKDGPQAPAAAQSPIAPSNAENLRSILGIARGAHGFLIWRPAILRFVMAHAARVRTMRATSSQFVAVRWGHFQSKKLCVVGNPRYGTRANRKLCAVAGHSRFRSVASTHNSQGTCERFLP